MALTDGTMLADDMAEMIADLPCTVEFGGDSFSATWSGIGRDLDVAGDGVLHKREVTLCCNVSDFTTVPEETQTIKINTVNYYIDTRMDSPDGIAVTFVCRRV